MTTPPETARAAVNPWIVAVVVAMATFMEVLDTTIANVAKSISVFVLVVFIQIFIALSSLTLAMLTSRVGNSSHMNCI